MKFFHYAGYLDITRETTSAASYLNFTFPQLAYDIVRKWRNFKSGENRIEFTSIQPFKH